MANIQSAKKQALQNEKRRLKNLARKTGIKTAMKRVFVSIQANESIEKLQELLKDAEAKLARAKNKGVLHANTVSRKVSSLAKKVAAKIKNKATA